MRRLSLIFLPFLAAFSVVFGLYYLYAAFRLLQSGQTVSAGLLCVFGLVGLGLAAGIWTARRRVVRGGGSSNTNPPA